MPTEAISPESDYVTIKVKRIVAEKLIDPHVGDLKPFNSRAAYVLHLLANGERKE